MIPYIIILGIITLLANHHSYTALIHNFTKLNICMFDGSHSMQNVNNILNAKLKIRCKQIMLIEGGFDTKYTKQKILLCLYSLTTAKTKTKTKLNTYPYMTRLLNPFFKFMDTFLLPGM